MHFVKKVPTSEEERAIKKKENDLRAKKYLHIRDKIVDKRAKGEYDDEMLQITQAVLEKNADIYTFWNIRRTVIEKKLEENERVQKNDSISVDDKEKSKESIDNLLSGELSLSYECIKGNPKSYSAWFQRSWVLQRQKNPDLEQELQLCQQALKLDCRNFHCWDHRRIVARMAKKSEVEELNFSNKLIEDNFSNYSAWHYRSIAIQKRHNELTGELILDDKTIEEELEKVKNAFYMDAEDQSAWTYTRWLLEAGSGKEFLRPESSTPVSLISVNIRPSSTTFVFTRAVTLETVLTFVDVETNENWKAYSSTSPRPTCSKVWRYLGETEIRYMKRQDLEFSTGEFVDLELLGRIYDSEAVKVPQSIEKLLEDCKMLTQLEPNNKWPIYMRTLALMEYQAKESFNEIMENLKKLETVLDTNRAELYKSVASRQALNEAVRNKGAIEKLLNDKNYIFDGRYLNLTSTEGIEYLAGLIENADFSGNDIREFGRIVLPNAKSLTLNENENLKCLSATPNLASLETLQIASTGISETAEITPFLGNHSLQKIIICETPLAEKADEIRGKWPEMRVIQHWL